MINILGSVADVLSSQLLSQALEKFLGDNKIKINLVAWEAKEDFIILKLDIWSDRTTLPVTSIELEDTVNHRVHYFSDFDFSEYANSYLEYLRIDPSSKCSKLSKYNHYTGETFVVSPEKIENFSVVFNKNIDTNNLKNYSLNIKSGNSSWRFNLKELTLEIPTISDYVKLRGIDIEKLLEVLEL